MTNIMKHTPLGDVEMTDQEQSDFLAYQADISAFFDNQASIAKSQQKIDDLKQQSIQALTEAVITGNNTVISQINDQLNQALSDMPADQSYSQQRVQEIKAP